ncbi:MAG: zinc-binding alcohol dehydrogenase family protein [Bifidobacterium tibiigranuli]|jgi:zinc-binding alcohol dehydrogenase family protein|uniref:zinc-binding alcohol dehydrogenase family protein n=1 Tax=Bifidobacterium tibiigranuli TaxID=2172043 RepID=UPI0026F1BEF5|nr:zinc-binding alcohol dehydrogenase family protein [Bifidobacterium tibiigranuli]MCI1672995.1 zinc-binding alcohol dehydrogenase family protein [Bifidobacterium tibiigranuli]MCI1713095.1 zinc-binding alcohol dehydrogenase family protein [Bifidobacterium tibiigranuli]
MNITTTAIGYEANLPITDPSSLVEREIELPSPRAHDLLVEVKAVSVNPADVKLRAQASAKDFPSGFRVLGFDAAGVVESVGSAVTLFNPGDEVFYAGTIDRPGTNQRLHLVDERIVGRKPASLSFADAAALPLTSITAWEVLFDRFGLTPESCGTLLVVGATGGVGSVMVQLAEALLPKVSVIATASTPERAEYIRELGAEYTVNHRGDLTAQVLNIAPQGVDWLFTAHSEHQLPLYAEIVRPFGQIAAIDDGPRDVEPLKAKSITWHWELMFTRPVQQTPDMIAQHELLDRVADLVDEGRLRTTVTRTITPINAATLRQAHELVESGRTVGKVVVAGWE